MFQWLTKEAQKHKSNTNLIQKKQKEVMQQKTNKNIRWLTEKA